jgi:hypothetical protein
MRTVLVALAALAISCAPIRIVDGGSTEASVHDAASDGGAEADAPVIVQPIDGDDIGPAIDVVDTFVRDVPPPRDVVDVTRDVIDPACADARVSPYYECFTDCDCGPGSVCASLSGGTMPRVCLPACEVPEDCPLPPGPGFGVVTPICAGAATDHRCHLSGCSVGGGSPACPPGLHCVGAMPGATHGECHPD